MLDYDLMFSMRGGEPVSKKDSGLPILRRVTANSGSYRIQGTREANEVVCLARHLKKSQRRAKTVQIRRKSKEKDARNEFGELKIKIRRGRERCSEGPIVRDLSWSREGLVVVRGPVSVENDFKGGTGRGTSKHGGGSGYEPGNGMA